MTVLRMWDLKHIKGKLWVLRRKLNISAKADRRRRYGILYDKTCWMETLREAWKKVRDNKGSAGVDGQTIEWIEKVYGVDRFLSNLQSELKEKRYCPKQVRRCYIDKSSGGKRGLSIPTIKDRVCQMAVKLIIEPIFEADFQDCSYGFRPGKSPHQAINEVCNHLVKGRRWIVDLDIKSCFDSIPHDKLMELVSQRISDKWILRLIRSWLKAGILDNGKAYYTDVGTPQGGVISPLLMNVYLNELDKEWIQRGYNKPLQGDSHLIRYCDDMVTMCPREETAQRFYKEIGEILKGLGLSLNKEKSRIVHEQGRIPIFGVSLCLGVILANKTIPISRDKTPA